MIPSLGGWGKGATAEASWTQFLCPGFIAWISQQGSPS